MQIRYDCPVDDCVAIIEYEPLEECGETMECPRCHTVHPMHITDFMREKNMPDQCAVCGSRSLFVRKDFPQKLGAAIVVVFGILAIYFFTISVVKAWLIMIAAGLLDLAIYLVIGKVTTCYTCRAGYRKCNLNPAHEVFDLATSEKY